MNDILEESPSFRKLLKQVDRYASSSWPVLILGETGVGKELVAKRVHYQSSRRTRPFVPVNCGALPGGLFESELFGYERGAFSGAVTSQRGLLRFGNGGTVFFDEVADLELSSQVKLLRFLDSGEIRPVGGTRIERADLRVVAATNVDLYEAVARGKFRLDLLERVSVLTLNVPPLRERKEDLLAISRHFFADNSVIFDEESLSVLLTYDWPGNIRQLKNILARAALLCDGKVRSALLGELIMQERSLASLRKGSPLNAGIGFSASSLADIEKQVILNRLKFCRGNRKRAAKELGIAKSTLHEKLRRWKSEALREVSDSSHSDDLACPVGDRAGDCRREVAMVF